MLLHVPTELPTETEHACDESVGYSGQPLQAPLGSVPHEVLVLFVVGHAFWANHGTPKMPVVDGQHCATRTSGFVGPV